VAIVLTIEIAKLRTHRNLSVEPGSRSGIADSSIDITMMMPK
jgi:hypothetical protein